MDHSGGSGPGGATVVGSVGSITATGWHPVQKFPGTDGLVRWR